MIELSQLQFVTTSPGELRAKHSLEQLITAFHEAGHAIVGHALGGKVTNMYIALPPPEFDEPVAHTDVNWSKPTDDEQEHDKISGVDLHQPLTRDCPYPTKLWGLLQGGGVGQILGLYLIGETLTENQHLYYTADDNCHMVADRFVLDGDSEEDKEFRVRWWTKRYHETWDIMVALRIEWEYALMAALVDPTVGLKTEDFLKAMRAAGSPTEHSKSLLGGEPPSVEAGHRLAAESGLPMWPDAERYRISELQQIEAWKKLNDAGDPSIECK